MKILYTADWHIKLGVKNIPDAWQINRFSMLYKELHKIADEHNVDVVINGGDIFDNPAPTIYEIALFMDYVRGCKKHQIIYDGNHEATDRGVSIFPELKRILGASQDTFKVIKGFESYMGLDFVPFSHLHKIANVTQSSNILCTHVRGEIPPHVKAEIDLDLLNRWDVVLAGDLHSVTNSQRNILYPGTPLSTSFHRSPTTNGVYIVDTDTLEHTFIEIKLPQLIRLTVNSSDEIVKTDYDHTIYEVIAGALDKVDTSNPLLDKKIATKDSKAKLDFSSADTVTNEMTIYYKEVLKLKDNEIKDILSIHDNIKQSRLE